VLIYGEVVPLSQLSPGEWFVLMRRKYDDVPDSLEPVGSPYKLHSIEGTTYVAHFMWRQSWHRQNMSGSQLVCRCDPNR
jgi:hypothetical protein